MVYVTLSHLYVFLQGVFGYTKISRKELRSNRLQAFKPSSFMIRGHNVPKFSRPIDGHRTLTTRGYRIIPPLPPVRFFLPERSTRKG